MLNEQELAEFKELLDTEDAAEKAGEHEAETDAFLGLWNYLKRMQGRTSDADILKIEWAVRIIKRTVLPAAYVDGIRAELLLMVGKPDADLTYVYMTFWGMEDRADYMKIGIAKNVRKRMSGAHTDNPMNRLWTFTIPLPTRSEAMTVEAALLQHMAHSRITGEWVKLSKFSEQACKAMADSLAEVASVVCDRTLEATGG